MFYVYVVKNEFNKVYTGQTSNLERRLKRHNGDLPAKPTSYTSKIVGAWKIIYKEECPSREEALRREKFLKSHKGREWLKIILGR